MQSCFEFKSQNSVSHELATKCEKYIQGYGPYLCMYLKSKYLHYSDLPNNCAANLIIFRGKNTYTTLLESTHLLISETFPSKPDFHLHKLEKNPSYTALLRPTH